MGLKYRAKSGPDYVFPLTREGAAEANTLRHGWLYLPSQGS